MSQARPAAEALAPFGEGIAAFVAGSWWVAAVVGRRSGLVEWVDESVARLGIGDGATLWQHLPPDLIEPVRAVLDAGRAAEPIRLMLVGSRRSRPLEASFFFSGPRFLLLGEPVAIQSPRGLSPDAEDSAKRGYVIGERGRAIEEAVRAVDGLRLPPRTVAAVRWDERRRLERNLHDTAQQVLLAVGIGLERAALASDQPQLAERLLTLRRQLDDALADLRAIVHGSDPADLITLGIARAVEQATARSPVPVSLRASRVGRYDRALEAAVYYACLEAFQNAVKHAAASTIEIEIEEVVGRLRFRVRDDGRGLPPGPRRLGHGLLGVRERLHEVDGRLRIVSAPGRGTTVSGSVSLPVGAHAASAPESSSSAAPSTSSTGTS